MTKILFIASIPLMLSCEGGTGGTSGTSGSTGNDGPLTVCIYNYSDEDITKKALGEPCTTDDECSFAECIMPGDTGNESNATFGFCTRGCDCDNDTDARLTTEQKQTLVCHYPAGNQGKDHHVLTRCSSLSDCTALDSRFDECALPSNGGVFKICRAGVQE
ncbi:MAG: hypothetical protein ACI9OJ_002388 [Myxococcota bacterium]|jgi:hypothetical protein